MSVFKDQLKIDFVSNADQFQGKLNQVIGKGQAIQNIFRGLTFGIGLGQLTKEVTGFADLALKFDRMSIGFRNLATSMGEDSAKILANTRAITLMQISAIDATESLNKALTLIPPAADELDNLATIATGAAFALGTNVKDTFDDILTGLGRASPKILDNLGIVINSAEAFSLYAKEIGKGPKELGAAEKQIALLNYVLDQNLDRFTQLARVAKADPFQVMSATFTDLRIEIGNRLIPAASSFLAHLNYIIGTDLDKWANGFIAILTRITVLFVSLGASKFIIPLVAGIQKLAKNAATAEMQIKTLNRATDLGRLQQDFKRTATHANNVSKAVFTTGGSLDKLSGAVSKSNVKFNVYAKSVRSASDAQIRALSSVSGLSVAERQLSITKQKDILVNRKRIATTQMDTAALQQQAIRLRASVSLFGKMKTAVIGLWSAMWPLLAIYAAMEIATFLWRKSTEKQRKALEDLKEAATDVADITGNANRAYNAAINTLPEMIAKYDDYNSTQKLTIAQARDFIDEYNKMATSMGASNKMQATLNETTDEHASVNLKLTGTMAGVAGFTEIVIDSFGDLTKAAFASASGVFALRKELIELGLQTDVAVMRSSFANLDSKIMLPAVGLLKTLTKDLKFVDTALGKIWGKLGISLSETREKYITRRKDGRMQGEWIPDKTVTRDTVSFLEVANALNDAFKDGTITMQEYGAAGKDLLDDVFKGDILDPKIVDAVSTFSDAVGKATTLEDIGTQEEWNTRIQQIIDSINLMGGGAGEGKEKLTALEKALQSYNEELLKFINLSKSGAYGTTRSAVLEAASIATKFAETMIGMGESTEDFRTVFQREFVNILSAAGISLRGLANEFGAFGDEAEILVTIARNVDVLSAEFDNLDTKIADADKRMKEFGKGVDALTTIFENIRLVNLGIADANEAVKNSISAITNELQAIATSTLGDVNLEGTYTELLDELGKLRVEFGSNSISASALADSIDKTSLTTNDFLDTLTYTVDKLDVFDSALLDMARSGKWSEDILSNLSNLVQYGFDTTKTLANLDTITSTLESMSSWSVVAQQRFLALSFTLGDLFNATNLIEYYNTLKEIYEILKGIKLPDLTSTTVAEKTGKSVGLTMANEFFNALQKLDFSNVFSSMASSISSILGDKGARGILGIGVDDALGATGELYSMAIGAGVSLLGTALDALFGKEKKLEGADPIDVRVINEITIKEPSTTFALSPLGSTFSRDFRNGIIGGVTI